MQYSYELPVIFTFEQVQQFGELTKDDGPVHSVDGVVQGGFILSMLPKWLKQVVNDNNSGTILENSVSMILNAKFRNKLKSNHPVTVRFIYEVAGRTISKLEWQLFDDHCEYCFGTWVIHRS